MNWAITLIIFNSTLNNETKNNNYLIVKLSSFFKRQTNDKKTKVPLLEMRSKIPSLSTDENRAKKDVSK